MKNKALNLFILIFALHFSVMAQLPIVTTFNLKPSSASPVPIKKNIITVDNRSYIIPDSIKIIKQLNGQFKVDQKDLIGHKVGNGGDYIRSTFIQLGQKALDFITTTDIGHAIAIKNNLNSELLKLSLDIQNIVLTNDILFDNAGSVVDAIGLPGLIILNSSAWLEHFENERNVYYLIFHEMLRSTSINDDNYIISTDLINFPNAFRLSTRLLPLIPMLESDSIQNLFDFSNIAINGSGCVAKKGQLYTELDLAKNSLEISLNNYVTSNDAKKLIDYKACSLAIPVKLPKGKRLVISLVDMQGSVRPNSSSLQTTSTLKFEAFLAGSANTSNMKVISLGTNDRTFLFRKTDVLSSGCGTNDMIRLNTSSTLASKVISTKPPTLNPAAANISQIKKISVYMNMEDCN
ncbi:MAG: DUF4360 domain-containing protein [Pseudobdellovibrio sp.]